MRARGCSGRVPRRGRGPRRRERGVQPPVMVHKENVSLLPYTLLMQRSGNPLF